MLLQLGDNAEACKNVACKHLDLMVSMAVDLELLGLWLPNTAMLGLAMVDTHGMGLCTPETFGHWSGGLVTGC